MCARSKPPLTSAMDRDSTPVEDRKAQSAPARIGVDHDTVTFTIRKIHLYVTVALVVGFGGGFGFAAWLMPPRGTPGTDPLRAIQSASLAPAAAPNRNSIVQVATEGRPTRGPRGAPVTVVEFTDYQCPFCRRHFQEIYPTLLAEYDSDIRYVVRNFPMSSIHPWAQKASEAAECALDQGRFWEYHDALFQHVTALGTDSLKRYAVDVGLTPARFNRCLDSGEKAQVVSKDIQDARSYGVSGTPTFFINGEILIGAQPLAVFKTRIDQALQLAAASAR